MLFITQAVTHSTISVIIFFCFLLKTLGPNALHVTVHSNGIYGFIISS